MSDRGENCPSDDFWEAEVASSAQEQAVLHPDDSACWTQGPPALTLLWASADAAEIDGKTEASELKNQVSCFLKAASDFLFLLHVGHEPLWAGGEYSRLGSRTCGFKCGFHL